MRIRLYLAPDEFGSGGTVIPTPEQAQGQEQPQIELVDFAAGGKVYKVPKEVKQAFGQSLSSERTALKKEIETIQRSLLDKDKTLEEKQVLLQKYEEQTISAEERAQKKIQAEIEKSKKEIEQATGKATTYFNMLKSRTIDGEILSALSEYKTRDGKNAIWNLGQTATLFKNSDIKILYEENPQTGDFETKFELTKDGNQIIVNAKEAVQEFLSREGNLNLLVAEGRPGGSTQYTGAGKVGQNGKPVYKSSDFASSKDVRDKFNADLRAGLQPQLVD